ncbi:MAG: Fic family protein [Anaerolineales bacterium]|nr:Fic family protein [Anaerolineales bacterium]
MKRNDFKQNAPGKIVKTSTGYYAFIPAPLPPKIKWTDQLLSQLSNADRGIAQLSEVGASFPAPHVVVRPFIRREAVVSSRIEGTQTSLQELLTFEARQLPLFENPDAHEVHNYVKALDFGLERVGSLPVSQRLIREVHTRLMQGVRGEYATPGEFRRSQNWIGGPGATIETASYVPPPVEEMLICLSDLEKYIHSSSDLPPLIRIGLIHCQFEAIHPFLDGNGRVGRLLVSLLLSAWGLLPQPLLYLSAYFEVHRQEYYDQLLSVSQKGTWEAWLEFFLDGVDQQARESTARLRSLGDIRLKFEEIISPERTRKTLALAVDFLMGQPIITVSQLQDGIGLNNFVTAQRYIDRLIELGILRQLGGRSRNRLFIADEILKGIEGALDSED